MSLEAFKLFAAASIWFLQIAIETVSQLLAIHFLTNPL